MGYPATAHYIARTIGGQVPLSRVAVRMRRGDEALVVRLTYRVQDVDLKHRQPEFSYEDWEIGLLQRFE